MILTSSVEAQPLSGFVTVSVYVPEALISGFKVFSPVKILPPLLVHAISKAGLSLVPFKKIDVVTQFNSAVNPASTIGTVVFSLTVILCVSVHPFSELVINKSYCPA